MSVKEKEPTMKDEELNAIKNLRSIRRSESYAGSVLEVYATLPKGAFYDDLAIVLNKVGRKGTDDTI